jgi:hypothetical protein
MTFVLLSYIVARHFVVVLPDFFPIIEITSYTIVTTVGSPSFWIRFLIIFLIWHISLSIWSDIGGYVFECRFNTWIAGFECFVSFFEMISHEEHPLPEIFWFSSRWYVNTSYVVSPKSFFVS